MRVLVTGANGFLGKNLLVHLRERGIETVVFTRDSSLKHLSESLANVNCVFHLAGVNRPQDPIEFVEGNKNLTARLSDLIQASGRKIPILYTSSEQAESNNPYGESKLAAEKALVKLEKTTGSPVYIYRLPNVFGKWSQPNYNSVVATFCHNIAHDLPIQINDPNAIVHLVYIDDVITDFLRMLDERPVGIHRPEIAPTYSITVGDLAKQLHIFKDNRESSIIESVGFGLMRALYSTYLSFLSPEQFSHPLVVHTDPRGHFAEVLKTKDSGQFSFFTAHSGVTRGGHYHHSKNEKFLVIQGKARFGFRHINTGKTFELVVDGKKPEIVETVPGWAHDITNIGETEMLVLLWANEIFDPLHPDTIKHEV